MFYDDYIKIFDDDTYSNILIKDNNDHEDISIKVIEKKNILLNKKSGKYIILKESKETILENDKDNNKDNKNKISNDLMAGTEKDEKIIILNKIANDINIIKNVLIIGLLMLFSLSNPFKKK